MQAPIEDIELPKKKRRRYSGKWGQGKYTAVSLSRLAGVSVHQMKIKLYELRDRLSQFGKVIGDEDLGGLITDIHLKKRLQAVKRVLK